MQTTVEDQIIRELGSRRFAGVEVLATDLNVARTTVRDTIKRLVIKGYLQESKVPRETRGRPRKLYSLSRKFKEGRI